MDIIVGGPLKPNGQNVPTRVGEIVSDYSELANIPNPRVGMEVWVASKKEAVRILTLKEATIAGVMVPNAVVDTWEVVPNRAMTTSLATKISEEEQRATEAEGALATKIGEEEQRATEAENALRDKVADLEENYIAKMSELDTEVESLHSEDANLQSNINEIQLDLQSKINELGQEYLKGIEDVNRGITRIDAKAIQIGSFEVESLTDGIGVNFSNIDGTQSDSFEIPAATTKTSGVMSAEDKKSLDQKTVASLQVESDAVKVAVKGVSLSSTNATTVDIPAATTKTSGVMSADMFSSLSIDIDWIENVAIVENGKATTNNNFKSSDYLHIPFNVANISASGYIAGSAFLLAFYDAAKSFISGYGDFDDTTATAHSCIHYSIPDNARYFRVCTSNKYEAFFCVWGDNDIILSSVNATADKVAIESSSISGAKVTTIDIPSATTESAGVMSAEDKKEQVKKTPLVNGDIIVGQAREVYSRQGKIDSATFLKRTTAGGTSVSDGVASVKQIGGNIVKNLVDGTFGNGWNKFATTTIADGVAKITTTSPYTGISYAIQFVTGHKYYAKVDACGNNAFYASFTKSNAYYISQQWACVSFLHTGVNNDTGFRIMSTSAEAQGFFKNPLVIDLTDKFGAGNEPTKEECDRMFGAMDALPQGLTIAQPAGLKSTGYNQCNPSNVLKDKTIADNAITNLAGSNIAIVECLPCAVGAGENNGYVIGYGEGDDWSDDGIEVYLTPLNPMDIEGELYMHKLEKDATYGSYVPQIKGYLLVVTPTTDKLCAHFAWSGDRAKTDYEEYAESNIAIPSIPSMSEWGLAGISSSGTMAQDTIDLDRMVYTKRIGCFDGGESAWYLDSTYGGWVSNITRSLARVGTPFICDRYPYKGMYTAVVDKTIGCIFNTRPFIKDSSYTDETTFRNSLKGVKFYYELAEPEEYPIVTKTAPNYIGSDYGVEEFTGSKIPLAANILFYMRSLVGETRNFLDRLMARLGASDATAVADKIADAILPQDVPTEGTDVEPTEVIEE